MSYSIQSHREDNPYCEPCFGKLFGVACSACNKPIIGRGLQVGGQIMHTKCVYVCVVVCIVACVDVTDLMYVTVWYACAKE